MNGEEMHSALGSGTSPGVRGFDSIHQSMSGDRRLSLKHPIDLQLPRPIQISTGADLEALLIHNRGLY